MAKLDIDYIASSISDLSYLPVRVYKDGKQTFKASPLPLPKDPFFLCEKEALSGKEDINIYAAPHFFYYGIVRFGNQAMVLGPTRIHDADREENVRDLAFDLAIPKEEWKRFSQVMSLFFNFPFTSLLKTLAMISYVLTGKRIDYRKILPLETPGKKNIPFPSEVPENRNFPSHNTIQYERDMLHIIQEGDVNALEQWISSVRSMRPGKLSDDYLRQQKNLFIVTVTLVSRAAIAGGLSQEDSLSLSDGFIQRAELMHSAEDLLKLNLECLREYTNRVRLFRGNGESKLADQVTTYLWHNLSKRISLEELADALFLSKSTLCKTFRKEMGISVQEFLTKKKIEIACRYLEETDRSLQSLADYLGFSSLAHFSSVFHKNMGMTPSQFRLEKRRQKER